MKRSTLDIARSLLRRKEFGRAIILLESEYETYRGIFEYFYLLGTACLYAGDIGNAARYYDSARKTHTTDTNLLLGQAVLFLRRGDTASAIHYYLDILARDPGNKIAEKAMKFIETKASPETIAESVDTGEIMKFYPPVGFDYSSVFKFALAAAAGVILSVILIFAAENVTKTETSERMDMTQFVLTEEENKNPQQKDISGELFRYILTDEEIRQSYEAARVYFKDYRENAAQVEINRILNSNAVSSIKDKAKLLMSYFKEPTFDTITDNFSYATIAKDSALYEGCWVVWSGRITNSRTENNMFTCDFLLGYENFERLYGVVPLHFEVPPSPPIDGSRALTVLAKIRLENGKILLDCKSVYQPVEKN